MKSTIVHGIDDTEGTDPLERRASDIKEVQNLLKDFCEVELKDEDIVKSMRLGKYDQIKKRPILIAVKTEDKKCLFCLHGKTTFTVSHMAVFISFMTSFAYDIILKSYKTAYLLFSKHSKFILKQVWT